MSEDVKRRGLGDGGREHGAAKGLLDHRFMQVVAIGQASFPIEIMRRGGEDVVCAFVSIPIRSAELERKDK